MSVLPWRGVVFASVLLCSPFMQAGQLQFDVASITENKSLDAGGTMRLMPGGGISVRHLPARSLVTIAYQLQTMKAVGSPIWSLLQLVITQVGAPVSDETELDGPFDFDLRWSNEVPPAGDLQSIYTALPEQLGLKLERRRVTTDVFIIDHMERATSN